jgi:putative endonuclease
VFYTYVLRLSDNSIYVGFSSNLKQRVQQYNWGEIESTKNLRPVKLIYYSAFELEEKAAKFEKYLKSSSGFAFRNKHLL